MDSVDLSYNSIYGGTLIEIHGFRKNIEIENAKFEYNIAIKIIRISANDWSFPIEL